MHQNSPKLLLLSVGAVAQFDDSLYSSEMVHLNSIESSALIDLHYLTYNDFTNSYTPSEPTQNPFNGNSGSNNGGSNNGGSNNGGKTNNSSSTLTKAPAMPTHGLPNVPASIESVLETAVPASFYQELENPTSRSSMFSEWHGGNFLADIKICPLVVSVMILRVISNPIMLFLHTS